MKRKKPEKKQIIKKRARYCFFDKNKIEDIDYKDIDLLKRFVSEKGKIRARRTTGTCAQHQHKLAMAIKRARQMALIPYTRKPS
ncbi:MAG: 30S ribosomal protein S18 [Actinobacteria bacterium]|nr:MAG: 30S ribosomal protein S18 [Actinomycetota bacterium]